VLFPVCLAASALGIGLLLERVSLLRLPGPLLVPAGLAGAIVLALPLTLAGATAELIAPLVVGTGIAGLALLPGRASRPDPYALGAAGLAFAAYAAPFVRAGETTLGGYVRLDDTASWLAIADWVGRHGIHVSGLAPSSYEATLDFYLNGHYPVGGLLPLIAGDRLIPGDEAWLYQPYLALLAALLALALYVVAEPVIPARPLRMLAAAVASMPAVLFGYVLWGGFKEPAAAWLLALVAALLVPTLKAGPGLRQALPLATGASAMVAVLSAGAAVWLVPMLVAGALMAPRTVRVGRIAAIVCGLALVLSIPSLLGFGFLGSAAASTVRDSERLANLVQPLSVLQLLGIWPVGDFRLRPQALAQTHVLMAIAALATALGLAAAWRRDRLPLLAYVASALAGCAIVVAFGSPWVAAKALATASPAPLLAAFAGAAAVLRSGRRVEALAVAGAIAGGVIWSNALAYRDVSLAPHDRFEELRSIGDRIAGAGPTLMTEYEPYGVRWFLRRGDPEGASELRRRRVALRGGALLERSRSADIGAFGLADIEVYRTLVLRRSPLAARPPSSFALVWSGRYYEVWQRTSARVLEHVPRPTCGDVLRLAGRARRLAAAPAAPPVVATGGAFSLARGGRYGAWLEGSFPGRVELSIDGARVATARREQSHDAALVPLADVTLAPGPHTFTVSPPARALVLAPAQPRPAVVTVPARDAKELCGRPLEWAEALT
jgi:hypothetical protein